jgi:hypothetical protein
VAGSRRRQQAQPTEPTRSEAPDGGGQDTGSEAWPEDAVNADDLVTETEAGPLEESDFDDDADDDADGESEDELAAESDDDTTEAGAADSDEVEDTVEDEETDTDQDQETDGDSAEEKGK